MTRFILLFFISFAAHANFVNVIPSEYKAYKVDYDDHSAEILFPAAKQYQPSSVTITADSAITHYEVKYGSTKYEADFDGPVLQLFFPHVKSAIHIEVSFKPHVTAPIPPAAILIISALTGMALISRRKS